MPRPTLKKLSILATVFLLLWLGARYLLPIVLPFLLGISLALLAEKPVSFLNRRMHIHRGVAAGIGVTATLVLLLSVIFLLLALLVRQLTNLASALPDLEKTATDGLDTLETFLLRLASSAPGGMQPLLHNTISNLFSDSSAIVDSLTGRLAAMASSLLGHVPGSALAIGTGILCAYMVSARLPQLRVWLKNRFLSGKIVQLAPTFKRVREALFGWLKAQLKLSGLSFLIVLGGFLLLRVRYAPIWAVVTALVDAIPVLGTGTVLIPWSLILLVQGEPVRAVGMLSIYIVAFLARSILEPRLVGRQLGIDPLMTLLALYAGYRLWGFGGVLLSPLLCVAATELLQTKV